MDRTIEDIANEVLRCARSWDGGVMLVGNVEAREIENLAIAVLDLMRDVSALNEGWEATTKQLEQTAEVTTITGLCRWCGYAWHRVMEAKPCERGGAR